MIFFSTSIKIKILSLFEESSSYYLMNSTFQKSHSNYAISGKNNINKLSLL